MSNAATYAYEILLSQLEQATTQDDVDQMLRDYGIYVRGMLENQHAASEVTAERIIEHVGKDVGWLLGEVGDAARARVIPMLPEEVRHPILGRQVDVSVDDLILAGAIWVQGLPRGGGS